MPQARRRSPPAGAACVRLQTSSSSRRLHQPTVRAVGPAVVMRQECGDGAHEGLGRRVGAILAAAGVGALLALALLLLDLLLLRLLLRLLADLCEVLVKKLGRRRQQGREGRRDGIVRAVAEEELAEGGDERGRHALAQRRQAARRDRRVDGARAQVLEEGADIARAAGERGEAREDGRRGCGERVALVGGLLHRTHRQIKEQPLAVAAALLLPAAAAAAAAATAAGALAWKRRRTSARTMSFHDSAS